MKSPKLSLRAGEPVRAGLLRVGDGLIRHALGCIERPTCDPGEDVHAVRTTLKRLRALLRLVRPAIGRMAFERENARLRKAAQRLASSRDAQVARQTLAGLRRSFSPVAHLREAPLL